MGLGEAGEAQPQAPLPPNKNKNCPLIGRKSVGDVKGQRTMNLDLSGKSVIVTGGGSNIGRAISLAFAREGAHLTVAEIDEGQGEKVVAEAQAQGARVGHGRADRRDQAGNPSRPWSARSRGARAGWTSW